MKDWRFPIVFAILVIVQIVLCNFLDLSRYIFLSILPLLMMMLPLRFGNIPMMLAGFALGFVTDFFSTGMLGLTSAALVLVGLGRNSVMQLVFGEELVGREDGFSLSRVWIPKFAFATMLLCALYVLVYVWAEDAGTSGFWALLLRFVLSTLGSTLVSVPLATTLRSE